MWVKSDDLIGGESPLTQNIAFPLNKDLLIGHRKLVTAILLF